MLYTLHTHEIGIHYFCFIVQECAAVADRYVEKQVLRVLGLFGCNKINRSEVKDSVSGAVSLILGTSKDNKALDISPMKEVCCMQ